MVEAEDRGAQSDWICGRILQNRENGIALNSHAILVPTNRHASELAEELLLRGIPAQHLGYLFERSEVKDLLALLSLCCDREGTGLWRVATLPEFAIPRSDVSYLLKSANAEGRWSLLFLSKAEALPNLSEEGKAGVANLWKSLEKLAYLDDPWQILTRFLFDVSNYLKPFLVEAPPLNEARPLTPDSGGTQASSSHPHSHTPSLPHPLTGVKSDIRSTQSLLAIFQLLTFVQELSNRVRSRRSSDPQGSFKSEFMARLRFLFECKQAKAPRLPDEVDQLDAVRIMTIHQSKGLEFPVVFLPNLVKGQFPTRNTGRMATLPPGLLNEARPLTEERPLTPDSEARLLTPDSGGIQASSSHYHSLSPTLPHPKSGGVERESDDDENEEEDNSRRLFFVALTRARDSLSLIRPLKWKEKPEPASPRLTEIGNLLEGLGCLALGVGALESSDTLANAETPNIQNQTLNAKYLDVNIQTPNVETPNAEAPNTKTPNAPLSHSAIKLYMQCPRRYFYRYVERLPAIGEASNYLDFYTILNETLSRIRELASTGIKPESGEIQALFDAKWGESEEGENGHREALRQRAHSLISDAISEEAPAGGIQVSNLFRAEFPAGAIEVRADRAEILDDGTLLLTKEKLRGVKKDDHTSIELALLRRAARAREPGRKVVIALHYLPEAKTAEAPDKPKLEEKRVAKYELALESLASGDFTPSPSDDCPACPYYLICSPEAGGLNFSE